MKAAPSPEETHLNPPARQPTPGPSQEGSPIEYVVPGPLLGGARGGFVNWCWSGPVRTMLNPLLLFLLAGICLTGCQKKPGEEAIDSDCNGYVCRSCSVKFYTDRKVFAERCPSCKAANVASVVAFFCDKDQNSTLTARGPKTFICEKCQSPVNAIRLPGEAELRAWGASKKSKAEVAQN